MREREVKKMQNNPINVINPDRDLSKFAKGNKPLGLPATFINSIILIKATFII